MASGLMYVARLQSVTLTNVPTCLWEISTSNTVGLLLHSIRIDFCPVIAGGVAQDARAMLAIQTLSSIGSGGTLVTPAPLHPRNAAPSTAFIFGMLTVPGTVLAVKSAETVPIFCPYERIYTEAQRIPIPAATHFAISVTAPLGPTIVMSSELYF